MLYGNEEPAQFYACYLINCELPLYVFYGWAMPGGLWRRTRIDGAKRAAAVMQMSRPALHAGEDW